MRRVNHLDWLEAGVVHSVEQGLVGAEQDGTDVQKELIDRAVVPPSISIGSRA